MPALSRPRARRTSGSSDRLSAALRTILDRYGYAAEQAVRRHKLTRPERDEVLQDVRIRLWKALATADRILSIPPTYVYQTALSAARDLIRRRRSAPRASIQVVDETLPSRSAKPDEIMAACVLTEEVSQAIRSLVESRSLVVKMHILGYHRNEIAERLGWSEAKTRNLLYRGLADLRSELNLQ